MEDTERCWYCKNHPNDSHGIDLANPYPPNVEIGQTYRITIYPTSSQVLALAKPDRWLIVDQEWLDENEDAFGNDVCYHITDDVLTVDRQSLHEQLAIRLGNLSRREAYDLGVKDGLHRRVN